MALDFAKGIATGVVSNNLRRVAGNLPGMLTGKKNSGDTSPFKKLTRSKSPNSVQQYKFPIDVDSDPGLGNHGHYMIFNINQQTNAKLSFGPSEESMKQDGKTNMAKAVSQYGLKDVKKKLAFPAGYGGINKAAAPVGTDAQGRGFGFKPANATPDVAATPVSSNDSGGRGFGFKPQYVPHHWQDKVGMQLLNQPGADFQKELGYGANFGYLETKPLSTSTTIAESQAIHVKRKPTTKLHASIALYMPANVQVNYGANYTDTEIGSMAGIAADAIQEFLKGGDDATAEGFRTLLGADETLAKNTSQFLLGMAGNLAGFKGSKELEAMIQGRIISNRMELAFKGIEKRKFQYTFKMIPRNAAEAEEIRDIIYAFKFNMLPEFEGGDTAGRSFIVPNTFDIKYMYNGNENTFLNKISTCVLETMNVTYGGDRYKTYTATAEGAPPVETTITLNFHEMEMITREAIKDRGM